MDETTITLARLNERQQRLNKRASPEARSFFELGRRLGGLAMMEDRDMWRHKATHDKLTRDLSREGLEGALNRDGLEEYLETAKSPKAALLVDATNFKAVNDRLGGYKAGDQVIVNTYELLNDSVRPGDKICRWGGDEFVIILNDEEEPPEHPDSPMAYERRAQKPKHAEHIADVKERIANKVNGFLAERPELRAINFDLAVGGGIWEEGVKAEELVDLLKKEMEQHKELQHRKGKHREP